MKLISDTHGPGIAKVNLVPSGAHQFISFNSEQGRYLAAWGLKGDSVAVIVSNKGVLLANIACGDWKNRPLEHTSAIVRAQMNQMKDIFIKNKRSFDKPQHYTYAVVICGEVDGEVSKNLRDAMVAKFNDWTSPPGQFPILRAKYVALPDGNGAVFVDGRGPVPKITVDDKSLGDPFQDARSK